MISSGAVLMILNVGVQKPYIKMVQHKEINSFHASTAT
jgi:hypothetical protein